MNWIIEKLRSCVCVHDYEKRNSVFVYDSKDLKNPKSIEHIFRCTKCGHIQKRKI